MPDTDLYVRLPLADWETLYAALMHQDDRTPLAGRLFDAIDVALNARIDASLAVVNSTLEGA